MADKEEILTIQVNKKSNGFAYKDYGIAITRQEAIEKMALSICDIHADTSCCEGIMCENCEGFKFYIKDAEAAINALLGVEK